MKEIVFTFSNHGCYLPNGPISFDTENHLKLVIQPHDFELKLSGDILRNSSCKGYIIEVSCKGQVCFYDYDNNLLATAINTERDFSQIKFTWKQDKLHLSFGKEITVDNYPNCDGESDRWSTRWNSDYEVILNTATNQIETI